MNLSDFVDNMKKDFLQRNFFLKEAFLTMCGFGYIMCWTLEPTSKQKHSSIGPTKQGSISKKFIVKELGVYWVYENMRDISRLWYLAVDDTCDEIQK